MDFYHVFGDFNGAIQVFDEILVSALRENERKFQAI